MPSKNKTRSLKGNYHNLKVKASNRNRTKVYSNGNNESVAVSIKNHVCDSSFSTPSNVIFINSILGGKNIIYGPIQKLDIKKKKSFYRATITYEPIELDQPFKTMTVLTKSPTLQNQLRNLEEKLNLIELMRLNTHSCEWHRINQ